jgi:hypothetical protein
MAIKLKKLLENQQYYGYPEIANAARELLSLLNSAEFKKQLSILYDASYENDEHKGKIQEFFSSFDDSTKILKDLESINQ